MGSGAVIGGTIAELTGGRFYEGAVMGVVSAGIAVGASELIGVYLPEIKKLEAKAIEMLGENVKKLEERSLGRKFEDRVEFSGWMTEAERDRVNAFYESTKDKFSPNIRLLRSIDKGHDPGRFGPMHVRFDDLRVHFDIYDIVTDPFNHLREYLYQYYKHNIQ